MSIAKSSNIIAETAVPDLDQFLKTGVIRDSAFAICDDVDKLKQIKFDASLLATNTSVTISPQASSSGTFSLPNTVGGTIGLDGNGGALQYAAPANGATVTMSAGSRTLILEPAGTIAGATVVLPIAPPDGTIVSLSSTGIITTLTLSAGAGDTIVNAITTLLAAGVARFAYVASTLKWYKI